MKLNGETNQPDHHYHDYDHYPKAVYALDGGRPIEGVCNSPEELQKFQRTHSLVQVYPISSMAH